MDTYINTKEILGENATLNGLVSRTLEDITDCDVRILREGAFDQNKTIKAVNFPNVRTINSIAFRECSSLVDVKIGLYQDDIAHLVGLNIFAGLSPRYYILVPDDLVEAYKSDSNWSIYGSRIYGISDETVPKWVETEITDTTDQIIENIANGTASTKYKLGQYKPIDLGSEGVHNFQIIAKNADELASGDGYAQLTWFPMDALPTYHAMNAEDTGNHEEGTGTIGGWDKCSMKQYLLTDIWPKIPIVWRNAIKAVKKYSKTYNTNLEIVNNVSTDETIFLLSSREVFGISGVETIGPIYSFGFPDSAARIRKRGTVANRWWLRTANSSSGYWEYSSSTGTRDVTQSQYGDTSVAFGFCT